MKHFPTARNTNFCWERVFCGRQIFRIFPPRWETERTRERLVCLIDGSNSLSLNSPSSKTLSSLFLYTISRRIESFVTVVVGFSVSFFVGLFTWLILKSQWHFFFAFVLFTRLKIPVLSDHLHISSFLFLFCSLLKAIHHNKCQRSPNDPQKEHDLILLTWYLHVILVHIFSSFFSFHWKFCVWFFFLFISFDS